jgi:hypothetical protein
MAEQTPRPTCKREHPDEIECANLPEPYVYPSPEQACKECCGKDTKPVNPRTATEGPCIGEGTHYRCQSGSKFRGTIACCPCCEDTPRGPDLRTLCRCTRTGPGQSAHNYRGHMMAEFDPKAHLKTLRSHNISLPEWFVLNSIGTWPLPRDEVPGTCAGLSEGDPRGSVTEAECARALEGCINKGWLTVVGHPYLDMILWAVKKTPAIGPIYGFPNIGDVDFTPGGAALYTEVSKDLFGSVTPQQVFEVETPRHMLFFRTKKDAESHLKALDRSKRRLRFGEIKEIGPWRVYWWLDYPRGYAVRVAS